MSESLFSKVAGVIPTILLRKKFQHRYFSVNFRNFSEQFFLYNTKIGLDWVNMV